MKRPFSAWGRPRCETPYPLSRLLAFAVAAYGMLLVSGQLAFATPTTDSCLNPNGLPVPKAPAPRHNNSFYRLEPVVVQLSRSPQKNNRGDRTVSAGARADPLSMLFHFGLAWCLLSAGQCRESIACARRAMEIDPNFHLIRLAMGFAQMDSGLHDGAMGSFQKGGGTGAMVACRPGCLAAACCCAGDYERGREYRRQFARQDGLNLGDAIYYAKAGEADAMFAALESAYRKRDFFLPSVPTMASFDPLPRRPALPDPARGDESRVEAWQPVAEGRGSRCERHESSARRDAAFDAGHLTSVTTKQRPRAAATQGATAGPHRQFGQ